MVMAFAGRRIDAENSKTARFPSQNKGAVLAVLTSIFMKEMPLVLTASAACGSDLLAVEAATRVGIRSIRIVLPFSPEIFRETSVTDRANADYWGKLFDHHIANAQARSD